VPDEGSLRTACGQNIRCGFKGCQLSSTCQGRNFEILRQPLRPFVNVDDLTKFHRAWSRILRLYTQGLLFALAGIIDFVQRCAGLTNAAGLLVELLQLEILWSSDSIVMRTNISCLFLTREPRPGLGQIKTAQCLTDLQ
jgi:hypothetical protein